MNEPFPADWHEWQRDWHEWLNDAQTTQRFTPVYPWGPTGKVPAPLNVPKNFLADEVLGVWQLETDLWVELSEVTWPTGPSGGIQRYVGVTFASSTERWGEGTAESFSDLDNVLFRRES